MSWVAVGVAAVTVVGGAVQNNQNKKAAQGAANAQNAAQMAGIEEQRRQFDTMRQDQMPWLNFGRESLGGLQALMAGDYSGFENSPDYKYAQEQGMNALNRRLSAGGVFGPQGHSGQADADAIRFGQGLATQYLGNYRNFLQSGAGIGQSAANNLGQAGMNMAGNIQNAYGNIGNARASSYYDRANSNNQFIGGTTNALANLYGTWMGSRGGNAGASNLPGYDQGRR